MASPPVGRGFRRFSASFPSYKDVFSERDSPAWLIASASYLLQGHSYRQPNLATAMASRPAVKIWNAPGVVFYFAFRAKLVPWPYTEHQAFLECIPMGLGVRLEKTQKGMGHIFAVLSRGGGPMCKENLSNISEILWDKIIRYLMSGRDICRQDKSRRTFGTIIFCFCGVVGVEWLLCPVPS